jgi:hypothetical protein
MTIDQFNYKLANVPQHRDIAIRVARAAAEAQKEMLANRAMTFTKLFKIDPVQLEARK